MKKHQNDKQEITLMTILANEATNESRDLLQKYNRPDAKSYADLEVKLAELYFDTEDKVQLEKEMAQIHPHKNWILDNTEPKVIIEKEVVEVVKEIPAEQPSEQTSSLNQHCNNPYCNVHGCSPYNQFSNFNDIDTKETKKPIEIPFAGLLFGVGLTLVVFMMVRKDI